MIQIKEKRRPIATQVLKRTISTEEWQVLVTFSTFRGLFVFEAHELFKYWSMAWLDCSPCESWSALFWNSYCGSEWTEYEFLKRTEFSLIPINLKTFPKERNSCYFWVNRNPFILIPSHRQNERITIILLIPKTDQWGQKNMFTVYDEYSSRRDKTLLPVFEHDLDRKVA